MRLMTRGMQLALLLLLVCAFGTSALAATIRSASGYGQDIGFSACSANVSAFDPTDFTTFNNCIGVQQAQFSLDVNGIDYLVFQYAFVGGVDGSEQAGIFDIVNVGSLAAGNTFTLPLVDPSALTGVFSCDNEGKFFAIDSLGNAVSVPCTAGNFDSTSFTQSGGTFTLNSGLANLTFFTVDGNLGSAPVTTPEPGSLMLLGTGLAAIAGLRRRKQ